MNSLFERPALGIAGIVLLAVAAGWWLFGRPDVARSGFAMAPVPVVVIKVVQRDVPHVTSGIGTVQSLHSVNVRSRVDGVLEQIRFQEGQLVKEGDLLAEIDDRAIVAALDQARAEKARNEAQLEAGKIDLNRYQQLAEKKIIPAQTVDQQSALVRQWKAGIEASDAAIAAAEVQLSYTRITSPVSGRAGIRHVDPGNLVHTADAQGLVTVTQMDPIAIVFSLPQEQLPQIQQLLNHQPPAAVNALDRDGGVILAQGRLTLMDNQIDTRTGTIELKAEFPNTDGKLMPGQSVTVQLRTGVSAGVLTVAASAVQRGRDHLFVYRVNADKVEAVPVSVSYEDDEIAVIDRGLSLGDVVVSDGQSRLRPGAAVKISADATATRAVAGGQ